MHLPLVLLRFSAKSAALSVHEAIHLTRVTTDLDQIVVHGWLRGI